MKKLVLLMAVALALPVFAQSSKATTEPAKPAAAAPSKSTAPQIPQDDVIKLLQLQLQFGQLSEQMKKLQTDGQTLSAQYNTLAAGLCKSTDGKTYTVELGVTPACKEVPPAPKK